MFRDEQDAREKLGSLLSTEQVERVVAVLRPIMVLAPLEDDAEPALGATRVGGMPDLPPDLAWPIRPVPPDVEAIVSCGGFNHGDRIRKHLEQALPYEFFCQIDLAEAARLGELAADLPGEGRLLFFYDSMTGPWDTSTTIGRVIWDRSPAATLRRQPLPEVLVRLGEEWVQEAYEAAVKAQSDPPTLFSPSALFDSLDPDQREALIADLDPDQREALTTAFANLADLPPPKREDIKSPYWSPASARRIERQLSYIDFSAVEHGHDPALQAVFADPDIKDVLQWDIPSETGDRTLLLGTPVPVQDDPRYDAVVVTQFGGDLSHDEWQAERERIFAAAAEWRLLLQVLCGNLDGTVYFLIRRDDLAARDFTRVVAVYQQT
jgi:hypothetical protein